ncbi:MAG TPA: hypothetical protein VKQ36_09315 [Ktedonobacterales bacterium]|nr:hypothetical protein [Ktedonobacterales bacterium]
MLWRQGDVLIETTTEIPVQARKRPGPPILAYGEVTGHSHRIEESAKVTVWELGDSLYIKITSATRVIHDEHGPITLPAGIYRVWRQREYDPQDTRFIRD